MINILLLILGAVGAANAICREYIFAWIKKLVPEKWEPVQILLDCTTCCSFHTGWILGLCFGYGWLCIPMGLTASIVAHIIEVWEGK